MWSLLNSCFNVCFYFMHGSCLSLYQSVRCFGSTSTSIQLIKSDQAFVRYMFFFKSCWEKSNCCLCCCCCSCCCTLSLPPLKVLLCCSSEFGQLLGEGVSCTAVPSSVVTNTWSSHLVILICFKISEAKESMSWNYLKVNSFWLHIMHLLLIHFKIMEKICMVSHDRSNCQSITINTQWSRGNVKKPQNRGIKGGVGWGWWI